MISRFEITHERPDFGIATVPVGNREVPVTIETALDLPFGKLLRFAKDIDTPQPRVLVVAPLSGHFATLLRGTVETLLRDHEVYVTDWANARDVPLAAGSFGVDDYVAYLIRFLEAIGPGAHILAVCQPCVQALAAVAVMSADRHPGDAALDDADGRADRPAREPDRGQRIRGEEVARLVRELGDRQRSAALCRRRAPGLSGLPATGRLHGDEHGAPRTAHRRLYDHLARGETAEAEKIKSFYDEYFAVLDLTEEFYIETIDRIFQKAELATGDYTFRGDTVDPGAIRNTALLTVEGGRDDICALGQTSAAHELCRSLRPHLKRHHLQANVGHYGVFSGKRWEKEIYPVVRNMILAME